MADDLRMALGELLRKAQADRDVLLWTRSPPASIRTKVRVADGNGSKPAPAGESCA